MLRNLGFTAIPLHGQMTQAKRLGSLNKFKSKARSILIATDVASRGLDIPHVDVVINFDIPTHSKDYIHRVGRTARAGRAGKAVTLVTQYDVELFQRIEHLIGKQLPLYQTQDEDVMHLNERVAEAQRLSKIQIKEMDEKKKMGKWLLLFLHLLLKQCGLEPFRKRWVIVNWKWIGNWFQLLMPYSNAITFKI